MAAATFYTLKFANTLKNAGVPDKQAEAQASAFAEIMQVNLTALVTKADLTEATDEFRREIADVRKELKQECADIRKELKQESADIRKELKQESADTRKETRDVEHQLNARIDLVAAQIKGDMNQLRGEMTLLKWMFGVTASATIAILVRLFVYRGGF